MIPIKSRRTVGFVAMQHHFIMRDSRPDRAAGRIPATLARSRRAVVGLVGCLALLPALAQEAPQQLPVTALSAGMHRITAEVARTPGERAIGLMHRSSMPTHHGMLFVFEEPGVHCFWMRNTRLPLSIAFLGDDGSVVNIADMQPHSEVSHCPKQPVRYALEMNQGWFAKRGLKPGSRIGGLSEAAPAR